MKQNTTKAKILAGEVVFGLGLDGADPLMVEYAALAGLDFVRIDCEQGPSTLESIEHMVRAAEAAGVTPTARVPVNRPEVIVQLLNRGVAGLTFPHISTVADAELAVRHAKFAPEGIRTVTEPHGGGMFARWSLGLPAEDPFGFANRETMVFCLIEDVEGLRNIEEIAAVPGVDVITFGIADLSSSMGLLGEFEHADVRAAMHDGIRRARAAGKRVGLSVGARNNDRVEECIELGVTVIQMLPAPLFIDAVARRRDDMLAVVARGANYVGASA